jgi:hypothetical protein
MFSLMTKRLKRNCGSGWDRVKRLMCCRFPLTGKAMGQAYQCWRRICREINIFSRFEYHMFYVLYPFVTYLLTLHRKFLGRWHSLLYSRNFPPFLWTRIFITIDCGKLIQPTLHPTSTRPVLILSSYINRGQWYATRRPPSFTVRPSIEFRQQETKSVLSRRLIIKWKYKIIKLNLRYIVFNIIHMFKMQKYN